MINSEIQSMLQSIENEIAETPFGNQDVIVELLRKRSRLFGGNPNALDDDLLKAYFLPLKGFCVTLHEDKGDKFKMLFGCQATCEDHAEEQALDAYPNGEVLHIFEFEN